MIAIDGFRPLMGHLVEKGRFYKLDDLVVRQYPAYFPFVVAVSDVLGEIRR